MQTFISHQLGLGQENCKRGNVMINQKVNELLNYGLEKKLIQLADVDAVANQILAVLKISEFEFEPAAVQSSCSEILAAIVAYAAEVGLVKSNSIDESDLFDTLIMGLLMPRPSEVNTKFAQLYSDDPVKATDYFYDLSQASNYIRTDRIAKDKQWQVETDYGKIDLTINLSKPEKDPAAIALAKTLPKSGYPKCVLCKENVGYAGTLAHPARQNHRIIPVKLVNEPWYLQYSPYVYYNEHCIVLHEEHLPMAVSKLTFDRILDFVAQFKHYFAGSNADLPIVGGSILTHDHFQGGSYRFAMDDATVIDTFAVNGYPNVELELLQWPLTTLRLKGADKHDLSKLADHILQTWREYSDFELGIHAFTEDVPHNTITPISRYRDGNFELDLVLRNNRTTAEYPDGIFHAHPEYHHLKKENIGLIEVMGLAILPGRLLTELEVLKRALVDKNEQMLTDVGLEKHLPWFEELIPLATTVDTEVASLIESSVGLKFAQILECCGVYKLDDAGISGIKRFIESL